MTTLHRYDCFLADLAHGRHDLGHDVLMCTLALRAPDVTNDATLADAQAISSNYASPAQLGPTSLVQANGVLTLRAQPFVIVTQGAQVQMRYVIISNASSANRLLGYLDLGLPRTLIPGALTIGVAPSFDVLTLQ